jgi:hypothetical protein
MPEPVLRLKHLRVGELNRNLPSVRNPTGRAAPAKTSGISSVTWPPVRAWDTSANAGRWDRAVSSHWDLSPPYLQPTPTGICDRFKHLTSYGTLGSKYSSGVNSDRALYVVTGSGSSRHRFSLQRQGEPQS